MGGKLTNPPAEAPAETRLRSMTGFARTVAEEDGFTLRLSLRSVNHRHLDLHVHLPEPLSPLEVKVRRTIKERSPRGHLELRVTLDRENGMNVAVDEALAEKYLEAFRRLGTRLGLSAETDLATLSRLPGVMAVAASSSPSSSSGDVSPLIEAAFWKTLEATLQSWDQMRAEEARLLQADLRSHVDRVAVFVERMEQMRTETVPRARQRLQDRLQAILGESGLDPARMAQEAALLADRADISEEIARLKAHTAQFRKLLDDEADAGKKLDFLLQEMNRELNTSLSKITALGENGLPMTQVGLEIKAEVEQLREQVQNLQ